MHSFVVDDIVLFPDLLEDLLNRIKDPSKEGLEWKFSILQVLSEKHSKVCPLPPPLSLGHTLAGWNMCVCFCVCMSVFFVCMCMCVCICTCIFYVFGFLR